VSTSIGRRLYGAALGAVALGVLQAPAALAQGGGGECQKLLETYRQELGSAESLAQKAAQKAMSGGAQALSSLGVDLGGTQNVQEAVQKGALAAASPPVQNAILIQLLSANTHLQEMIWRGCKPPSSSN
jgi:hypothetical protein